MVSREFIRSVIRAHHAIAVYMRGEQRIDGLSNLIYVIVDLLLDESEEKTLLMNTINGVDTDGKLKVKAILTSEVNIPIEGSRVQEFVIDTREIEKYETINGI